MIDVLLLLALPASGKSELRRYFAYLDPVERLESFGMGETVQIDDFPYVHMMRRTSEEAATLGLDPPFFSSDQGTFLDSRDWATLVHLINEDYEFLTKPPPRTDAAGRWLTTRLTAARQKAGADGYFPALAPRDRQTIELSIELEARALFEQISLRRIEPNQTVIIEFARGGPSGAVCPLPEPLGYAFALSILSPALLESAVALYVQVTPEQSRHKNLERAIAGKEGSILHHGVPEAVMHADYGMDDFIWLIESSSVPGAVEVNTNERLQMIPAAVLDNRNDLTSFLRTDPDDWSQTDLNSLRKQLTEAFVSLRE